MAYVTKELVQKNREQIRPILKKYGFNGTVSGTGTSTLSLNISGGSEDVIQNFNDCLLKGVATYRDPAKTYVNVNPYHFRDQFTGTVVEFLEEVIKVMNDGNHDRSDIMTDYFDVGWYIEISFGKWNKPYIRKG